jgi:hypothetical protein
MLEQKGQLRGLALARRRRGTDDRIDESPLFSNDAPVCISKVHRASFFAEEVCKFLQQSRDASFVNETISGEALRGAGFPRLGTLFSIALHKSPA